MELFCMKSDSFTIQSCVTSEAIKICTAIFTKKIEKFVKHSYEKCFSAIKNVIKHDKNHIYPFLCRFY